MDHVGLECLEAQDDVPEQEILIDPEDFLLSVVNSTHQDKCYYITLQHALVDANEEILTSGEAVREDQSTVECTTLVLTLEAQQLMDVCYLEIESLSELRISSDVVCMNIIDVDTDQREHVITFPLGESLESTVSN